MSDILNKQIERVMSAGEQIDIVSVSSDDEVRDGYAVTLHHISRLSTAIGILFPGEMQPFEGSVDCAIRLLEDYAALQQRLRR